MNASQIRYVRERLWEIERDLRSRYCYSEETPAEVKAAEQLIRDWQTTRNKRNERVRSAIQHRITAVRDELVLGDSFEGVAAKLQELAGWKPE